MASPEFSRVSSTKCHACTNNKGTAEIAGITLGGADASLAFAADLDRDRSRSFVKQQSIMQI